MLTITISTGQRAVVRRDGAVVAVLGAGRHRLRWPFWRRSVQVVDVRERLLLITGQEVSTADVPGIKVSAAATWLVSDPVRWLDEATDPIESLRLSVQLAVRDWLATLPLEQALAQRATAALVEPVRLDVRRFGIDVIQVSIRDVVLPGEVRRSMLAVATARQDGLATLEQARAETAALRALANGAKVLAENPQLAQLRLVQTAAAGGGSVVVKLTS